jgi:hypothetical protein
VPETCRELKNRINKAVKSGASSWFSATNIPRCTGNKMLNFKRTAMSCAELEEMLPLMCILRRSTFFHPYFVNNSRDL